MQTMSLLIFNVAHKSNKMDAYVPWVQSSLEMHNSIASVARFELVSTSLYIDQILKQLYLPHFQVEK